MNKAFTEKTIEKPYQNGRQARILVAPLDWGLGHATRCIPIIRELLTQGCVVWLAGEGAQKELLTAEFPELPFLDLPGYRIRYAKTAGGLVWKMIQQGPKMQKAIRFENRWLKKVVAEHGFDFIISDNRYGLYHNSVHSVFITHQLLIKSSVGKWIEKYLQKRNYNYINRFSECWVPDTASENNLAGELSHPDSKPNIPIRYVGLLSRFTKKESFNPSTSLGISTEKKNHLLIILSGPEPQRSILEEKIINEISHYNYTATIVRGLPGSAAVIPSTNMIKFYNHLSAEALNGEMCAAEYVISRSGYSTVMDIATLQKKNILIPTPGQTEQEYLGIYLQKKGMAVTISQHDFTIEKALVIASAYPYQISAIANEQLLTKTIQQLLYQSEKPDLG
jgi:UDP-N-acetylglucosamine transferase subunit ALG13